MSHRSFSTTLRSPVGPPAERTTLPAGERKPLPLHPLLPPQDLADAIGIQNNLENTWRQSCIGESD